jgi:hypothetical protein
MDGTIVMSCDEMMTIGAEAFASKSQRHTDEAMPAAWIADVLPQDCIIRSGREDCPAIGNKEAGNNRPIMTMEPG